MSAGSQFGRYTLVRQLAIGGMAEIHLARADGIGQFAKTVVLKRILPQYASNEDFVEMFLHEARLAARLQHPNVVQVFDIGEEGGNYFFTMEYVHGDDVRSLLGSVRKRRELLPIDQAIAIVSGAAAGLHHAHEQVDDNGRPLDMVHRDVSPSNLMLSFDGAVKVTDFGIAKTSSQLIQTRSGVLKGKISYMSPEQCRSDPLDRRSDIFALGIVLHELITGQKLFKGDNDYAILRRIVEEDAPLLSTATERELPPELDAIVARALARDRDQRYPTAQALQADLEAVARTHRLDTSSIALASYVRERLSPPSPVTPASDTATPATTPRPTPATRSTVVEPASVSNALGEVRPHERPRSRLFGIAAAVVAVGLVGAGVMWQLSGSQSSEPRPATAPAEPSAAGPSPGLAAPTTAVPTTAAVSEAPSDAGTPTSAAPTNAAVTTSAPASPVVDAGTPTTATPTNAAGTATNDAGVPARPGTRPRPRPQPATARPATADPCAGWTPNSLSPPPPGCELK